MFDDNAVKIFRKISENHIELQYKKDGEIVKELEVKQGQRWKVQVNDEMCHVEIQEFMNEGLMPVMAILKTDSKELNLPENQIDGSPAYPVLSLVSDGEKVDETA